MGPSRPLPTSPPLAPFTLLLLAATLAIHLCISWQRSLLCPAPPPDRDGSASSDAILAGLRDVDRKLDALLAGRRAGEASAVTNVLVGLRGQLNAFLGEVERSVPEWGGEGRMAVKGQGLSTAEGQAAGGMREAGGRERGAPGGKEIRMFIGVFSETNGADPTIKADHGKRREAIRDTWFPSSKEELDRLEREKGVVMRFVIGQIDDQILEEQISEEAAEHGDIMRLSVLESSSGLHEKAKNFFAAVMSQYSPDWIAKVDDDMYLMVDRLLLASNQWARMRAGYIGCMQNGWVWNDLSTQWFEPQHLLLGRQYFMHAYGTLYVTSGEVATNVIARNVDNLRLFASEEVSVGTWMLGHNVTYFEDMRLCVEECSDAAIGVMQKDCMGLCNPTQDMHLIHRARHCQAEPEDPLPYLQSHPRHTAFDAMRV